MEYANRRSGMCADDGAAGHAQTQVKQDYGPIGGGNVYGALKGFGDCGPRAKRKVPALMECGDIIPALENLLNVQAAYARGDHTSRAMRDVARKAFEAELLDFLARW